MSSMFDTNILVYLISEEPDQGMYIDPDMFATEHRKWLDCRDLIAVEETVLVSAVAWFELCNVPDNTGTTLDARLGRLSRHIIVEPLTIEAAERAAALGAFRERGICPKCLAHAETKNCDGCGREVGKALRLNDALIVAHAEVLDEVTKLFTYDEQMITLGGQTRPTLTVAKPPAASGVPVVMRYHRFQFQDSVPDDTDETGDSMSMPISMPVEDTQEVDREIDS